MATLRLFAAAREAAATSVETVHAETVGAVLAEAGDRHGAHFVAVLGQCRVWLNGEPAELGTPVTDADEIAVLPPVSGGSGLARAGSSPALSHGMASRGLCHGMASRGRSGRLRPGAGQPGDTGGGPRR